MLHAARRPDGREMATMLAARGGLQARADKEPRPTALMLLAGAAEVGGLRLLLELKADPTCPLCGPQASIRDLETVDYGETAICAA